MEKLITQFSIREIAIFAVVLALAIKAIVEFFDWVYSRLRKAFDREYKDQQNKKNIENKLDETNSRIKELEISRKESKQEIANVNNKLDLLIESDKDDIKSWLTREHHYFCYQRGWIDDYSLECCERRFAHYQAEGGNTFINGFMIELRSLPKTPPESDANRFVERNHLNRTDRIIKGNHY